MLDKIEKAGRKLLGIDYNTLPKLRVLRQTYTSVRNRFVTPSWVHHPDNIQIDTHNYCNLWMKGKGCIHCNVKPSGGWNLPRGRMPTDMIKHIIEYWGAHGASTIAPYINGEPMLDERLPWICDITGENNMRVVIDTNGTLFDNRKNLVNRFASQVRFSFSATTPETYEKVHGIDYFKQAQDTIEWFLKNRLSTQYPMLYYITDKYNVHEIYDYIKKWRGKAHLTLYPLHEVEGIQLESTKTRPEDKMYWSEITKKITGEYPHQSYRPINIFPDGKCVIRHFPSYVLCQGTKSFSVSWNGLLLHCTDIPYKYNYGHIYDHDMLKVWHIRNVAKIGHPACSACNVKHPKHDELMRKILKISKSNNYHFSLTHPI